MAVGVIDIIGVAAGTVVGTVVTDGTGVGVVYHCKYGNMTGLCTSGMGTQQQQQPLTASASMTATMNNKRFIFLIPAKLLT